MSHEARVDCYITDLGIARTVGARLGFELMEGQREYRGYSKNACAHAFRLTEGIRTGYDADYEIGLKTREDGAAGWQLAWDNFSTYGRRLEAKAGPGLGTLIDGLAEEAALRQLQRDGFRVSRTVSPDGEIQLLATR